MDAKTFGALSIGHEEMARLQKIGIYAVGGLLLFVIGRRVISQIKESWQQNKEENALKKLTEPSKSKMTISSAEATNYAKQLHTAMASMGTDTDTIDNVISKLSNGDDWKAVINAFGMKEYGTWGSPMWGNGEMIGLVDWFKKELSGSRLTKIMNTINSYGIKIA